MPSNASAIAKTRAAVRALAARLAHNHNDASVRSRLIASDVCIGSRAGWQLHPTRREAEPRGGAVLQPLIGYALGRWPMLTCYVGDGTTEIKNSSLERTTRLIALSRKDWLFEESDADGTLIGPRPC